MVKVASMSEINQLSGVETSPVDHSAPGSSAGSKDKKIVLTTFGSFGDVHPYVALGLELKERGHRPVIATTPLYREKIEGAGLEFFPVRPDLPPPEVAPDLVAKIMEGKKGGEFLFKELIVPHIRDSYEDLRSAALDADLLVTHVITFAGPILAQKEGIPWVSTVLAPASFFSAHDPFVPPQAPGLVKLLRLSPALGRAFLSLARSMIGKWIEPIYKFREELGLPRGLHPVFEGQHSPSLVLALFSELLGSPQPDWPPNTVVTGFPFYDKKDEAPLSPELERFLDEGPAPIVFTLGSSAIWVAEDFYRVSIEAASRLKRRAMLLIGDERNRPKEPLPEGIAAFDYAPYGQVLPRAAAIVHQGGVGTTGQSMRAGVPIMVVPFNHDQPDNADRLARLGIARTLPRKKYKPDRVAKELEILLTEGEYASRASEVGRSVRGENGAGKAADHIEAFLGSLEGRA